MVRIELSDTEKAVLKDKLDWATDYQVVRRGRDRILVRIVTPHNEEQYYTLCMKPEVSVVFHEPVKFLVNVQSIKGECRAGHQLGDTWEFSWCTPDGICGAAYHAMYPVLHGLMLTSGRYDGPAAEETLVSCPDDGWVTFRLQRKRWSPEDWDEG